MANVKKGDKLEVQSTYRARGYRLAANEGLGADFAAFDRDAHEPMLVPVQPGEILLALSDPSTDPMLSGQIYAEATHDGATYAVILLGDTYEQKS